MKISKPPLIEIIPEVPGVPGRPAVVLCPNVPPDPSPSPGRGTGSYITLCVTPSVVLSGVQVGVPFPLCTTVWSPTGG